MNQWLQDLGVRDTTVLGSAIGSLLSLRFVPGPTWILRMVNVACGFLFAVFTCPVVMDGFSLKDKLLPGIAFILGLIGVTLMATAIEEIPRAVVAFRKRFIK